MIKLQKLDPKAIRNEVLERHFETLKSIQKYFIDSTIEGFKERSEYAPFLAWGQQFVVLCKDSQAETKFQINKQNLERETL